MVYGKVKTSTSQLADHSCSQYGSENAAVIKSRWLMAICIPLLRTTAEQKRTAVKILSCDLFHTKISSTWVNLVNGRPVIECLLKILVRGFSPQLWNEDKLKNMVPLLILLAASARSAVEGYRSQAKKVESTRISWRSTDSYSFLTVWSIPKDWNMFVSQFQNRATTFASTSLNTSQNTIA